MITGQDAQIFLYGYYDQDMFNVELWLDTVNLNFGKERIFIKLKKFFNIMLDWNTFCFKNAVPVLFTS